MYASVQNLFHLFYLLSVFQKDSDSSFVHIFYYELQPQLMPLWFYSYLSFQWTFSQPLLLITNSQALWGMVSITRQIIKQKNMPVILKQEYFSQAQKTET